MKQTDENVGEMADAVADGILDDYEGLVIGSEDHQIMNKQLGFRIRRCLIAFHAREGYDEMPASDPQ